MLVKLKKVTTEEEKKTLRKMLARYRVEILGTTAEPYQYFENYWNKLDYFPFFILANEKLAGFALINDHCLVNRRGKSIAEFFIQPLQRKQGIGETAARQIFKMFPGDWEMSTLGNNFGAQHFWRAVIARYTKNNFQEKLVNPTTEKLVFTFQSPSQK